MKKIGKHKLYRGDCLKVMESIPDKSVDMILCDLPYGTTKNKWDVMIPFEPLWTHYKRIIKDRGAIVLFGSQPFTSVMVVSNIKAFRYQWVWEKSKASNFLLARKQPLKAHEDICVFSVSAPCYYPQKTAGKPFIGAGRSLKGSKSDVVNDVPNPTFRNDNAGDRFPRSVQYFVTAESEKVGALHPTQKPVALLEYLIKTYTLEGETVLDNCMGSGSTIVACEHTKRIGIGIEKDRDYFKVAVKRIRTEHSNQV
jgi:site-specific DNA-methyltransferase (adenine-specific)